METVFVSGALANKPENGGEAWVRLSWVLGLRQLGFHVEFVEELVGASSAEVAVRWFEDVTTRFGLAPAASLLIDGRSVVGRSRPELSALAREAALLVNISGHLRDRELSDAFRCKVYVDLDPGFTQHWLASGQGDLGVEHHDYHFTVGENVGRPGCSIPTSGRQWRPLRQPVTLDEWPTAAGGDADRLTTVATWRGPFGAIRVDGHALGLKVHQFRRFIELPLHLDKEFEIALSIDPADAPDRELLLRNGWALADPLRACGDPDAFRRYVQRSGAEFSVAQGMYVDTYSGWFSDRSVRYLASGKPVLVQDTGFTANLPTGEGLLAFRTLEEAVAGAKAIDRDYERHCQAARRLAEEYFDAAKVLSDFLAHVGIAP